MIAAMALFVAVIHVVRSNLHYLAYHGGVVSRLWWVVDLTKKEKL